ncbi:MAG: DNA gyrase inhibitor YacG [Paracoccaceae bacterium]
MSCPVCAEDTDQKYRPFCSRRCADIDLGKWLNEGYSIPAVEQDDTEDPLVSNAESSVLKH